MNNLRKFFHHKTSSVTSPAENHKPPNKKPSKIFSRTNTTKSLTIKSLDTKPSTKRKTSWLYKSPSQRSLNPSKYEAQPQEKTSRSAGALLEKNNNNNNNNNRRQNQASLAGSLNTGNNLNSVGNDLPDTPITQRQNEADEYIQQAIQLHETNQLEKATSYFKLAAEKQSPLGMFLYGIALRHGWGCKKNTELAVIYLQKAAESAVNDLHASVAANPSIARHELVMAIYELGVSFRHGWGVPKNKTTAAYYFEIAANLGDPDAQNDLGFCYSQGEGVKKDMKKAAKYYRMAASQGAAIMGNSWIYKKKYDEDQ